MARLKPRWRLPESIPPFGDRLYLFYRILWFTALALALLGPVAGIYDRWDRPSDNSALMLGSRLGLILDEADATSIRFPVGSETTRLGIQPGDRIVEVMGFPLHSPLPFSPKDQIVHGEDPQYLLLSNLLGGTGKIPVQMRIRSPDGHEREVTVTTGEQHIAQGAESIGIPPILLSFVDLLHVLTYPFLLIAAWFLHKRQPRDPVSCILSLAILLTIGAEQPSGRFLEEVLAVPRPVHQFLYDLGNLCFLSGILLFPHGKLSRRLLVLLAALPVLFFMHGDAYRALFMAFMLCAVLMLVSCLRSTEAGDVRQQIKWALFGFSGYAVFLASSLITDMLKLEVHSFALQLLLEMAAGLALGIAFLSLQLGLLIALVRFRLYDAEFVISRSATFAAITLVVGGIVAGVIQGLGTAIQNEFGDNGGAAAAGLGAALATVLINPVYERINNWMEHRFHKNLMALRDGLPDTIRDLREVATLPELLQDVLLRVHHGVQTVRSAIVIDGKVEEVMDVGREDTTRWLKGFMADPEKKLCDGSDPLFRVRVPLCANEQLCVGWLLVGPRPDGSSVGDDERKTLVAVADPVARAIRIVRKRDDDDREISGRMQEFARRIEALEAGLLGAPSGARRTGSG